MRRLKIPRCLKCESFCWWDGDYVCLEKLRILHRGILFDDEFVKTLKNLSECGNFTKRKSLIWDKLYGEEYAKWHKLHMLEKQLERHVRP